MTTWAATARPPDVFERIGRIVLRLFTSVDFAVVQIIALSVLALIGMTIKQLPTFAFRSVGDYEDAMAALHARYDHIFGQGLVAAMERLQLFHVFTSTWFTLGLVVLVVSIVICTLDRTPRLWRQSKEIRVVQPDAFYDPELADRAVVSGATAAAIRAALRGQRFKVREAEVDGVRYLYGDRNRWTKLATLISHLGLSLLLTRDADGVGTLLVEPYRADGTAADGSPNIEYLDDATVALRAGEGKAPPGLDFSIGVRRFSDYVLLIAKKDPGQGIVWTAFAALIIGLAITFYLPRRRIWARLDPSGEVRLVARSDRYVDLDREFARFLDDLVARRSPTA